MQSHLCQIPKLHFATDTQLNTGSKNWNKLVKNTLYLPPSTISPKRALFQVETEIIFPTFINTFNFIFSKNQIIKIKK